MTNNKSTSGRGPNRPPEKVAVENYERAARAYTRAFARAERLAAEADEAAREAERLRKRADYAAVNPDLPDGFRPHHSHSEIKGDQNSGQEPA